MLFITYGRESLLEGLPHNGLAELASGVVNKLESGVGEHSC